MPTQPPTRPDWIFRVAVWFVLFAIPASSVAMPLSEYDTGWHIRTGQWVREHGGVPQVDTFSTVGSEQPWVAYSWLYGLLVHHLHESFGLMGLLVFRVALALAVVLALWFLVGQRERRFMVQAGLTAAASVALFPLLVSERPGLFTILFMIWTLQAILALRDGSATRMIWLLPPVYAVWANLHIQFVYGFMALGLAWLAPVVDRILRRDAEADVLSRSWWKLTALGAACLAATFLNPYGWRIYEVVLVYAGQKETYLYFEELKAMEFRQPSDWFVLGLTIAAGFALGRRWPRMPAFETLLFVPTAYLAYHTRHDIWLVVLSSCVLIAGPRSDAEAPTMAGWLRDLGMMAAILLVVLVGRLKVHGVTEETLEASLAREFPVAAAGFLEQAKFTGPIYNPIDWGGFLIWKLPGYQVGIDGRTQLHGGPRVQRFIETWRGRSDWERDSDLNDAGVVLLQRNAPLAALLKNRRGPFRVVYEDEVAVVFAR